MKKQHGGYRPGAGRKPKKRNQDFFPDAQSYLEAVVSGLVEPDNLRVMAARCLIQYQKPRSRGAKKSPTVKELDKMEKRDIENSRLVDFEKKAAKIRKKFEERNKK